MLAMMMICNINLQQSQVSPLYYTSAERRGIVIQNESGKKPARVAKGSVC